HAGNVVRVLLPIVRIGDERIHDGDITRQRAHNLERQQRMTHVIQDAQIEDDVELSQAGVGKLVKIHDPIIDLGTEPRVDIEKTGQLDTINRGYGGTVALGFEAEPAVPRADIEESLALQVVWNRKLRIAA